MEKSEIRTCPYCKESFVGTRSLNRHIKRTHSHEEVIMFECKECGKEVEYTQKKGNGCSLKCNKVLQAKEKNKTIPLEHKYSFINIDKYKEELCENEKYDCPHCESTLSTFSKLKNHMWKIHTEHTGICMKCGEKNETNNAYCSRACANSREFSEESNLKTTISLLESLNGEKMNGRTINEFVIDQLIKIHEGYYKYPNLNYTGSTGNIKVECPNCGEFEIEYGNHQKGRGCSKCCVGGFKDDEPGVLYYLKVEQEGDITYKVGITNNTVKKRYAGYMQYITILHIEEYEVGLHARLREKEILDKYQEHKYEGPSKLGTGNKEVFRHDILSLDNAPVKIYFEGHDLIKNPNN